MIRDLCIEYDDGYINVLDSEQKTLFIYTWQYILKHL